ncbi:MAG TPA: UBP-type zinc finger domain-containing protein [Actinomycetota bacterium]|jgi:CPA1 family monovalent cation:H+ antiporter|nr:UBP-type zinc finger domain-containing protein [Actinomycetota bacterium]
MSDQARSLACPHASERTTDPRAEACEKCGSTVNLRVCTECGHVGCCESQLAHNTAHYRESGHAIIRSMPVRPGSFTWCYECERYL